MFLLRVDGEAPRAAPRGRDRGKPVLLQDEAHARPALDARREGQDAVVRVASKAHELVLDGRHLRVLEVEDVFAEVRVPVRATRVEAVPVEPVVGELCELEFEL